MSARLDELLEQHWRLSSSGDVARANAFLERVLDEFPSEPEVLARWGIAGAAVDLDEGKSFLVRAAELAADDPSAQVRIGRALHRLGAIDEALACAKRAKDRMPPDFEYNAQWASLAGRIAASKGETDLARTALQWRSTRSPGTATMPTISPRSCCVSTGPRLGSRSCGTSPRISTRTIGRTSCVRSASARSVHCGPAEPSSCPPSDDDRVRLFPLPLAPTTRSCWA